MCQNKTLSPNSSMNAIRLLNDALIRHFKDIKLKKWPMIFSKKASRVVKSAVREAPATLKTGQNSKSIRHLTNYQVRRLL